jgi:hypothetical protein
MSIADLKVRLADVQGIETLSTASEQGGSYFDGALAIPPRRRGGVRQRNDSIGDAVRDPETGDVMAIRCDVYESAIREAGFDVLVIPTRAPARPKLELKRLGVPSRGSSSMRTRRKPAATRSAGITKRNQTMTETFGLGPNHGWSRTVPMASASCVLTTRNGTASAAA